MISLSKHGKTIHLSATHHYYPLYYCQDNTLLINQLLNTTQANTQVFNHLLVITSVSQEILGTLKMILHISLILFGMVISVALLNKNVAKLLVFHGFTRFLPLPLLTALSWGCVQMKVPLKMFQLGGLKYISCRHVYIS